MPTLNPLDAPAWQKFVNDFDKTSASFQTSFANLLGQQNYVTAKHPELLSQYNALVAKGQSNANTLMMLKAVRDQVVNWLPYVDIGVQGVSSVTSAINTVGTNIGNAISSLFKSVGLGSIPVIAVAIGVAAASAALAAIAKWAYDAYTMTQRLNALAKAEAQGYTPQAAANLVNSVLGSPGGNSIFAQALPLLLIAGAAFVGLPMLLRGRE